MPLLRLAHPLLLPPLPLPCCDVLPSHLALPLSATAFSFYFHYFAPSAPPPHLLPPPSYAPFAPRSPSSTPPIASSLPRHPSTSPGSTTPPPSPSHSAPTTSASSAPPCTFTASPLLCPSCTLLVLFCSPNYLSFAVTSSQPAWLYRSFSCLPSLPLDLHALALFLLTTSSPSHFLHLLSLEGIVEGTPEATILHSFLSSVLPPPLPYGFLLELTVMLLAKDKKNTFGLMEPFREDNPEERRVQAHRI